MSETPAETTSVSASPDALLKHRRMAGALKESRERLTTVLTTLPAGILVIDIETHRIVDANPKALEMIGALRDQVIGSVCHKFICPAEEGHCPITDLNQCIDNSERELLTLRGERIPILKTVATVLLDGQPHLVESFLDLSRQKQTDKDLRESEERLRDLLDNANDLIQSVAPDGSLLYVNRSWRETLGYSEEEVAGLTIADIIHPDCLGHCQEVFRQLLNGDNFDRLETTFVTKDGRSLVVEGSVNINMVEGQPVSSRGIFRDISARKRAEKVLKEWNRQLEETVEERTRQLEEAQTKLIRTEKMAMVGGLVSGTAHELSNPLGGILNALQVLKTGRNPGPGGSAGDDMAWLEAIEEAALRCQSIVEDLKGLSEQSMFPFISVCINQVLAEALQTLGSPEGKVDIATDLQPDLPPLEADPVQLLQTLGNILLNARQALPGEGSIEVSTRLEKTPDDEADLVRITIKDNGRGIPPDHLPRIFDPFFTTRPVGQGTGLGLSVGYGVIKRHGGDIDVRSAPGEGTEVTVRLPLGQPRP
ncbi:PAS domain S-box protein [uncultured Desulfuromonas sp.]|mgnify:CR=1 FL=1|uniref:PAS domain S-box protein n=1 Tax=uncultured Desulfuromonas sp. TaxID=181013 RepID=UPI00262CBC59|nr:PAS domain S-box protein [uncultured Desulfuromonas sp.]